MVLLAPPPNLIYPPVEQVRSGAGAIDPPLTRLFLPPHAAQAEPSV